LIYSFALVINRTQAQMLTVSVIAAIVYPAIPWASIG